jgi:hypothetical protein
MGQMGDGLAPVSRRLRSHPQPAVGTHNDSLTQGGRVDAQLLSHGDQLPVEARALPAADRLEQTRSPSRRSFLG